LPHAARQPATSAVKHAGLTISLASAQDRNTKESRGFAFVRFYDKRDAEVGTRAAEPRGAAALGGASAAPAAAAGRRRSRP
jgi:hypothetical protein